MKVSKGLVKYLIRQQNKFKMWGVFDSIYGRIQYHRIINDLDKRLTNLRK